MGTCSLREAGLLWHWEGAGVWAWAAHSPVLAGNSSLVPLGVEWREENQCQLSNGAALLCDLKLSTADVQHLLNCTACSQGLLVVLCSLIWHLNLTRSLVLT